ncbi:MAG TPA: aminoglycoside phosphotransferase family protein [Allosphingosinicella sp.]
MFEEHLRRWALVEDGAPIITASSHLLPVLFDGRPAMLKVAKTEEEERGHRLMAWWDGEGSAAVLAQDGPALLMERAMGHASLAQMARSGRDEEATLIICKVANELHAHDGALPELTDLKEWFGELARAAQRGGPLVAAAAVARALLANQTERVALHGDLHHGNVLDFDARGWRAIDPKGLHGERTFDFANLLRNPDFPLATVTGRFARQATIVSAAAGLDRTRLLQWVLAFSGLSAAWLLADGDTPVLDFAMMELAMAELGRDDIPSG